MNRHRRARRGLVRMLAAVSAAFLALTVAGGEALATPPTPANGITWSPNQRVEYRWREGDEPPPWMRSAVNAAADDSNSSRAAKAVILSPSDSGASWIGYTADLPTNWAIGYTVRNVPTSFTMRLRPQGYPLDWGTLRWCQFYDTPPTGCYDAEMIALHEFGHAQTLGHIDEIDVTDWTDTVMHESPKTKAKAGWNAHEFGRCDVARLQIRYEPLRTTTPYSTCLDLPTEMTLSASAANVSYGGTVTIAARLKVGDYSPYPNLAGEPVAGRDVTLQKRAPGSSSWTNVGDMSALLDDTGRYSKSVSLTATYDWRAVFSAPASEGLEGTVSPVVRVTVVLGCSLSGVTSRRGPQAETC